MPSRRPRPAISLAPSSVKCRRLSTATRSHQRKGKRSLTVRMPSRPMSAVLSPSIS
jgi:hypothetical protein